MGQKTNPIGLRLGINKTWDSKWYDERNFTQSLREDLMLRRYIRNRLQRAGISKIEIARAPKTVTIDIHTARPGIVIGRRGAEVDKLRDEIKLLISTEEIKKEVYINIAEIRRPELDAYLVAENVASQLEQRVSFRRAMKKAVSSTMRMGAEGVRILCSGRLGGAEMSRREGYREGRVPLQTFRSDIDYASVIAHTTYGCIGVKVWICKGEIIGSPQGAAAQG
ncbi:MAG: 30S ribosomal protein S3 [bacterium]